MIRNFPSFRRVISIRKEDSTLSSTVQAFRFAVDFEFCGIFEPDHPADNRRFFYFYLFLALLRYGPEMARVTKNQFRTVPFSLCQWKFTRKRRHVINTETTTKK